MKFIIDTNILITAWKIRYPIDSFKAIWKWFEKRIIEGSIVICESVYNELKQGRDDLFNWLDSILKTNAIKFEQQSGDNVISSYSMVINYAANCGKYTFSALSEFGNNADGWVIAHALANAYILVTEELSNPYSKKSVKIPDICKPFGIQVINTVGMFRLLNLDI